MSAVRIDIDALRKHIGTKVVDHDVATRWPMDGMTVTLDRDEPDWSAGTEIPPGWHQFYFLPTTRPAELGPDGAPTGAGVIPSMPLPRRMFAGTSWQFHEPIRIGDELRRETELSDIQLKQGSTGTLVFATVTARIYGPAGLCVEETRGTAFREAVAQGTRSSAPVREQVPADVTWNGTFTANEALLFRFSALTFNTHRIHYDHPWATKVEGYPDLVVHGPLSSTVLINFARDHAGGRRMRGYAMRARAPLFANTEIGLSGRRSEDGTRIELWSATPEGTVAMTATATFD
ncbi:MAG: MaoC family dehydratase N-terminal domain-containing protein [Gammaproteobacteria bacterium]|nr:MaoC family dehydratase N-terminal domain-containing protein [Gammaproteobacteria bacterium]